MDAALFQRFNPEEYYSRFLENGLRPDGRAPHERRAAQLQRGALGSAHGSASVRLGLSAALAGVRAEVTEVVPELPPCGRIAVSVELPPLCSAAFRDRQRAIGLSTFLSNALTDIFNDTRVFNPTQLNVVEGHCFWVLHTHVICLAFDGNAFDLCLLAALAALEDTALPALCEGAAAEGGVAAPRQLVLAPPGTAKPLAEALRPKLLSRPLPTTFARLPGHRWVLDPCAQEEEIGSSVSLCLVGGKWLVFHRGGGAEVECFVGELMPTARTSIPGLSELLDGAVPASASDCDMDGPAG
mmetsp:Transcript_46082/g.133541  ORF Transcript_46082/g.133541 Transcript_46082/m.133541 type:complete len:298 (-) Transcript_46082:7-900(-)